MPTESSRHVSKCLSLIFYCDCQLPQTRCTGYKFSCTGIYQTSCYVLISSQHVGKLAGTNLFHLLLVLCHIFTNFLPCQPIVSPRVSITQHITIFLIIVHSTDLSTTKKDRVLMQNPLLQPSNLKILCSEYQQTDTSFVAAAAAAGMRALTECRSRVNCSLYFNVRSVSPKERFQKIERV